MTKRTVQLIAGCVVAVGAIACVSESRAAFDTVKMDYTGFNGLSGTIHTGGSDKSALFGRINWEVTGKTDVADDLGIANPFSIGQLVGSYCIELKDFVDDPTVFDITLVQDAPDPDGNSSFGPLGTTRAGQLTKLYNLAYDSVNIANTNTYRAAFQLAIWELSHENTTATGSYSVSSGNGDFYVVNDGASGAAIALANGWLSDVTNASVNPTAKYGTIALTNKDAQDQIYPLETLGGGGLPEATAMVTWSLILLSASAVTRPGRRREED